MKASSLSLQFAERSWLEMKSRGLNPRGEEMFEFTVLFQGGGSNMMVPAAALEALASAALLAMADSREASFKQQLLALLQRVETKR